uniref:Uncharacterized protein n=1 Tax=Aegilops tauschii TaxID=37682 RepID=M8CQU1_AEGTA
MLREILLRLPPRPSSLPRASLVSKRWLSLVADPQFQRRFRDHHGKPPLLGFFVDDNRSCPFVPMLGRPDRIPRARFSIPPNKDDRIPRARFSMSPNGDNRIVDCRHGLVLFLGRGPPHHLLVWDPVAREQRRLFLPPELDFFNAAVLRPTRGHFQVALITYAGMTRFSACLYSSETGIWGNINSLELESYILPLEGASTLIGNSFCWLLTGRYRHVILEFDLDTQSLAVTELPPLEGDQELRIVPAQDGGLGFIHVSQFHAQLWKRKPDSDGLALAVWVLDKAIEFEELRSTYKGDSITLVGFAEESNAVLALTVSGVFMVNLQSVEFKKISNYYVPI